MNIPVVLILNVFSATSAANPGPATQFFKDQQATLFDIGMFRLEMWAGAMSGSMAGTYLHHSRSSVDRYSVSTSATYDADDDMIYITTRVMDSITAPEYMEEGCRQVLSLMHINAAKSLWRLFAHYGEEDDPVVGGWIRSLQAQVELRCWVHGNSTADARFYACPILRAPADGARIRQSRRHHHWPL